MSTRIPNWFTTRFGIDEPQYRIPFVDFDLSTDVPLYIDPYAIAKDPSELAQHCTNAILAYFQRLLDAIRADSVTNLRKLISGKFAEPAQIYLGVGQKARSGRGLGPAQEADVISALRKSTAAKEGIIEAIQELELVVPHIGPDKISDLIANIILGFLARFTEATCGKYGITTRPCPVDGYWDTEANDWNSGFFNLPSQGIHSYILVPKRFVRRQKDLISHGEFYDKYILETLQRELLTADDSLVRTLKSGKRTITKKDLKVDPRFGLSKEFISDFIVDHVQTVNEYRSELTDRYNPVDPAFFSKKMVDDDPAIREALELLPTIAPGKRHAHQFHIVAMTLLEFIFDYALQDFEKEYAMDGGRGRIDIVSINIASGGFFLTARTDLNASTVPMECKNYKNDLGNNEFNQLIDRMGTKTSRLGLMVCRSITDVKSTGSHVTDRWLRQDSMILMIDDQKLTKLVNYRLGRQFPEIESTLRQWKRDVEYGHFR